MADMEPQPPAAPVWVVLFDRLVARWLFAFIALSALGLALLSALSHGWVRLLLSLPGHLLVAVAAGAIALLTRSPRRRRAAVLCLLADLAAVVPNLLGLGGQPWGRLLTGVLLLAVLLAAVRQALGAEPVDATVTDVPPTPEVAAARAEVVSRVPTAQAHGFHRPVLVLNPRSGSAEAVREQLLEAAGRYGVQLHEAETPAGLVALARAAVADGADVLGVAGGDGSLAAVAAVAIEAGLPFVCVPAGTRNHFARDLGLDRADPAAAVEAFAAGPERRVDVASVGERLFLNNSSVGVYAALVHEPTYRDDVLGALDGVLEAMLERDDVLPVRASFRDGAGNAWDEVLVLFVSNNPYPLSGLGGRPRLDAGTLEVSALRRTDGQESPWAHWTTTSFEVDSPAGTLEVGIDGEPVVLDTPLEFRIHAGALHVLLPPPRPASERPPAAVSPAPRRRLALDRARFERLLRLWRLLDRVGHREFGPGRDRRGE